MKTYSNIHPETIEQVGTVHISTTTTSPSVRGGLTRARKKGTTNRT
nr:MAG TPA_asm: hypothetical protein [Caudoviricetes sp.]